MANWDAYQLGTLVGTVTVLLLGLTLVAVGVRRLLRRRSADAVVATPVDQPVLATASVGGTAAPPPPRLTGSTVLPAGPPGPAPDRPSATVPVILLVVGLVLAGFAASRLPGVVDRLDSGNTAAPGSSAGPVVLPKTAGTWHLVPARGQNASLQASMAASRSQTSALGGRAALYAPKGTTKAHAFVVVVPGSNRQDFASYLGGFRASAEAGGGTLTMRPLPAKGNAQLGCGTLATAAAALDVCAWGDPRTFAVVTFLPGTKQSAASVTRMLRAAIES
jgi:hypothetical protein